MKEKTLYNLITSVRKPTGLPEELVEKTIQRFKEEGLIGEFHVVENGEVKTGIDSSQEFTTSGEYHITTPPTGEGTIREILNTYKLTTSGFDDTAQKAIQLGELILPLLEAGDPLSKDLNARDYFGIPINTSRDFITPLGWQSANIYRKKGEFIRLFTPLKEQTWYDIDVLKSRAFKVALEDMDFEPKKKFSFKKVFGSTYNQKQKDQAREIIYMNLDSIEKVLI